MILLQDFAIFLGRFHPLVLHFPIALILFTAVIEAYRHYNKTAKLDQAAWLVLISAAVTAIGTVCLGLLLSTDSSYQSSTLDWHRAFGLAVAVSVVIAVGFKYKKQATAYGGMLAVSVVSVFTAGHFGGHLTHGKTYLTDYAPRLLAAAPEIVPDNDVFATTIEPIFKQYCISCHGPSSQRGGLRLDRVDSAYDAERSGLAAVVPGDVMASEIMHRLLMDRADKKAMPPNGKPRPPAEQILALADWIEAGAPWAGDSLGPAQLIVDIISGDVTPVAENVLRNLDQTGVFASPLSRDNNLLALDFRQALLSDTEIAAHITSVSENLTWVTLSNATLSEDVFEALANAQHITRLDLTNTNTRDADLAVIAALENLHTLILTGTNVTEDGILGLRKADRLERLYLLNTSINPDALDEIQSILPNVQISIAANLITPDSGVPQGDPS